MARRILVLGASGHIGRRTLEILKLAGVDAEGASRRGPVVIDTGDPATFANANGFDVVLDLSDATKSPPDAFARRCVEEGRIFIEATSDATVIERLATSDLSGPGSLVLGAGLFTGISNLMARAAAERAGKPDSIEFAVAASPLSGAGSSTLALMVSSMATPAIRFDGGTRESRPMELGPPIDFGDARRPSLRIALAEPFMMHRSLGVPTCDAYFAPKPSFPAFVFRLMPLGLMRSKLLAPLLTLYFTVLRRFVFAWRKTSVEMVVTTSTGGARQTLSAKTADGMEAVAVAAGAIAKCLADDDVVRSGISYVDEVATLDRVLRCMSTLSRPSVVVS